MSRRRGPEPEGGEPRPDGAAPPRLAERLLGALLRADERAFLLGDLEEEHARRVARRGRRRAAAWYWSEVARSIWPVVTCARMREEGVKMTGLGQDLSGAARSLLRARAFTAVVVITLGLGVGGATAVYSVLKGVVLAPLAFEDPERVVMLWGISPDRPRMPLTVGDHNALARGVRAFDGVAASWGNTALLLGDAEPEQVSVGWITPGYLAVLGIRPALGRALAPDDDGAVLIGHDLWLRRYGGDPSVVGRIIDLGGDPFEIAGVLPPDRDPNLSSFSGRRTDYEVWRLQPRDWLAGDDRSVGWLRSAARLRVGTTLAQAQAEVDALMLRVNETVTERDGGTDLRVALTPVRADLVGGVGRTLWILLAAVCGVLLVAASNVAHLVLGRATTRGAEIAVRAALGGSRGRLLRQLLAESALLAVAGGALGLVVAWWGVHALLALAPPTLPRLELVSIDAGVFVFAAVATAAAALVFGVWPALRSTRTDLAHAMRERRSTPDVDRQRLSRALVVGQVALSLALVSGTGLLLRSLDGLERVDLGFDPGGVVTFSIETTSWGADAPQAAARMTAYVDRMESVPGVVAAGFTNRIPLAGGIFTGTYRSEAMAAGDVAPLEASVRYVTPGYLDALRARVVAGRTFRPEDGLGSVLLDERAAALAWPGESPVGRRVQISAIGEEPFWSEVVGVVAPMKHEGVGVESDATVHLPMLARAHLQNARYAAVRVEGPPLALVEPLRAAVREVEPGTVLAGVRTLDALVADDTAATRFATLLLSAFGGLALLLAVVGLHGVMSWSVRRRGRELAIRVALGARRRALLRTTLASGATLVLAGLALGALLALGLGELLGSLLYGVGPRDPATLLSAAALIGAAGLAAAYLPARLALGVDPVEPLRGE